MKPAAVMIQNAAAWLVFHEPKRAHVTPLFISLHWQPVAARIKFKTLMLAYRTTTGSAPAYFNLQAKTENSSLSTLLDVVISWCSCYRPLDGIHRSKDWTRYNQWRAEEIMRRHASSYIYFFQSVYSTNTTWYQEYTVLWYNRYGCC